MCGRFAQYQIPWEYLQTLGYQLPLLSPVSPEPLNRYNVPPRSKPQLIHLDDDGLRMEAVPWGYAPFWARGKKPPAINARIETAATSRYFREIWKTGRAVVPADGWYEWVADPANPKLKQPYYIYRADGTPMFFAALGRFPRGGALEAREGDGFVIITADSQGGMVDIHDRRPVVLSAECALHWLDPDLDPREAEEIASDHAEPVDQFDWYPVDRAVGNVRNEGWQLLDRING